MAKYDPLTRHLQGQTSATIVLTFPDVERIVGAPLPKSVRDNREWRENEKPVGSHVQLKAWQAGGYSVDSNVGRERVTFKRK